MGEKFVRQVKFLVSLNNPHVASLMAARGFGPEDRQEGWELLEKATGRHLAFDDVIRVAAAPNQALLAELDGWENVWFDVASAVLENRFPAVYERVFKNLSKAEGLQVVFTVGTLLNRLDELESGTEEEREALETLARRGLDKAQRETARAMLTRLEDGSMLNLPSPSIEAQEQQRLAAERMWRWYREWSQIARTVIRSRRLRIAMGISQARRWETGEDETEEPADAETVTAGSAPAAPASGATPNPGATPDAGGTPERVVPPSEPGENRR